MGDGKVVGSGKIMFLNLSKGRNTQIKPKAINEKPPKFPKPSGENSIA
jgi:hypothetical protein